MSTTKAGIGVQPAGNTPAGVGTPNTADAAVGGVLIDKFGVPSGSPYLDPKSRRYVFVDGFLQGERDVYHLVKMRVLTVKGTSAWPGGVGAFPRVIGTNFIQSTKDAYRKALQDLVDQGLIAVVAIDVQRLGPGQIYVYVQFRDLGTNELNSIEVG